MIPLGRSIPNLPTEASSQQQQQQQQQAGAPAGFSTNRRRSSLDAIMGHLKYVGAFPGRVMQDLSQPLSAPPVTRPGPGATSSALFPNGFLGMQSQSSFGSSQSSLGGSQINLNPNLSPQQGKTAAPAAAPKLPAAEAFLSI